MFEQKLADEMWCSLLFVFLKRLEYLFTAFSPTVLLSSVFTLQLQPYAPMEHEEAPRNAPRHVSEAET